MLDLLLLPISFFGGLAVYNRLERRNEKAAVENISPAHIPKPSSAAMACVQIVDIVDTNNRYDPIGVVLSDLDLPKVRKILGGELRQDMEGYI